MAGRVSGVLNDDTEALFRRVLRSMPATLEEHAAELGWTRGRAQQRLEELIELRLVRRRADGLLGAEDPRASLGRLLDTEEARLDERRAELLELRQAIESFESDYRRGLQLTGPRVPPWEEVFRSEISDIVDHLVRNSRGPVLLVTRRATVGLQHERMLARGRSGLLDERREQRSIFPLSAVSDPQFAAFAEERSQVGESQRYLADIPVEFGVFGRSGVLLSEGDADDAGFLLIRPPALIDAFVVLFESLWQRAEPIHEGPATTQDVRLLELLALGFKDEAIARHLGLGLRTVRRRLARLMEEHGVETRFQLGLAVARRGLLDDTGR
jgi:DNA-binding transcriptional ArsR family regulator